MESSTSSEVSEMNLNGYSNRRTFTNEHIDKFNSVFLPLMDEGVFLTGKQVDEVAIREMKDIFDKFGTVKVRNKYMQNIVHSMHTRFVQTVRCFGSVSRAFILRSF